MKVFQVQRRVGVRWVEEPGATMSCQQTADTVAAMKREIHGARTRVVPLNLITINAEFNQRDER